MLRGAAEGQSEPTSRAGARHDKILPPLEASIEASQRLEASNRDFILEVFGFESGRPLDPFIHL